MDVEDAWIWRPREGANFSICSTYKVIAELVVIEGSYNFWRKRGFGEV